MMDENWDFLKKLKGGINANDQSLDDLLESLLSLESEIDQYQQEIDRLSKKCKEYQAVVNDRQMQRIVLYALILCKMSDDNEDFSLDKREN